jgi:hypothetical protein
MKVFMRLQQKLMVSTEYLEKLNARRSS